MKFSRLARMLGVWGLLLSPSTAWSQSNTGAIAGSAKDTTGAVLPGVTVEASSPALIEKTRTTVTDAEGQYRIVDLRPGTYTVTFTLSGFAVVKREDVQLATGFTAAVNAEMRVGGVTETITVTGASPLVDVQNVHSQNVMSAEVLDALPTARGNQAFAALTLGARVTGGGASGYDVGGNKGDATLAIGIHGSAANDGKLTIDGMNFNHMDGTAGGLYRVYLVNMAAMAETTLATGSASAEWETSGAHVGFVPKDGGNSFRGNVLANFANGTLQSNNLNDELRNRGLTSAPQVKGIHDLSLGVGGPIAKNRLWFYNAFRDWHSMEYQPGTFFNKIQDSWFYEPDPDRPGYSDNGGWDESLRLTWQVADTHKITVYTSIQHTGNWGLTISPAIAPEAGQNVDFIPNGIFQAKWTHPVTNKLLLEFGGSHLNNNINAVQDYLHRENTGANVTSDTISVTDQILGIQYRNRLDIRTRQAPQTNVNFKTSYITGAHAFKSGVTFTDAANNVLRFGADTSYTFRNRVPSSLTEYALPRPDMAKLKMWTVFSEDQWTMRKLTLNLGVRFDALNGSVPPVELPGGRFLPATTLPAVSDSPNWKDIVPRLGVAYDLFGDGKTAVKASIGRYVLSHGTDVTAASSPSGTLSPNTTRTWNDSFYPVGDPRRGNYIPDCDLTNTGITGECGALPNNLFGTSVVTTRYADDVLHGWGARDYSWQASASIQHELKPGLAVNASYYRTSFSNYFATDNLATVPTDFSTYCITAPVDPRLPGGGGNQLCGLYDVNPNVFGKVNNIITQFSNYGTREEIFNGLDFGMTARFGGGGQLAGGLSLGKTQYDTCTVIDSPQVSRPGFCRYTLSWWQGQGQVKFNAIYPLPWWGLQTSITYQNLAGVPVAANYAATNAEIAPSLGRNLSAGVNATATVPLIAPNTMFEARLNQADVRFTKVFRLASNRRIQGMFDIYNLFNAATVVGSNAAYGSSWLRPTGVLGPRLFKFQVVLDF